jgi:hypothetical protein
MLSDAVKAVFPEAFEAQDTITPLMMEKVEEVPPERIVATDFLEVPVLADMVKTFAQVGSYAVEFERISPKAVIDGLGKVRDGLMEVFWGLVDLHYRPKKAGMKIAKHDGKFVIAYTTKEEDGKDAVAIQMHDVTIGSLPLPKGLLNAIRDKLEEMKKSKNGSSGTPVS